MPPPTGKHIMDMQECEAMPDATFRRLTGVRKRTFRKMVSVLYTAETHRKARGGKPHHLAVDMRLLMTLVYRSRFLGHGCCRIRRELGVA